MKLLEERWISIEKEFPANGQQVLTYGKKPETWVHSNLPFATAIFEEKLGFLSDHFCEISVEEVTHWMPLPKPPEGNQQ